MRKFLIAGSSLASVTAAGSVGAVDITLGGSIDMGIEFGIGKTNDNLTVTSGYNNLSLSISLAHTTDRDLVFGGAFALETAAEIEFDPYQTTSAAGAVVKYLAKKTVAGRTDIIGNAWAVSGGVSISVGEIVSVKINSDWIGVDSNQSGYLLALDEASFRSGNICKVAGRANVRPYYTTALQAIAPPDSLPVSGTSAAALLNRVVNAFAGQPGAGTFDAYLPAGQVLSAAPIGSIAPGAKGPNATVVVGSVPSIISLTNGIQAGVSGRSIPANAYSNPIGPNKSTSMDTIYVYDWGSKGLVKIPQQSGTTTVRDAAIFVGPFMEIQTASSETKMVVGAACLAGVEESNTAFFMDNASKVMAASDASIYIEGGFGKLTLQSDDYAGGVQTIAGAGDQADIGADGLVVFVTGYGLMGANPFIAVDLSKGDRLGDIEVITGGTFDLGGLSAAFDVALDNPADIFGISAWDLGANYAMGDLAVGIATDSSSDWGFSADMEIAGFGVNAVFGSSSAGDHEKAGITAQVTLSTALDGYALALGFDNSFQPSVSVDYDLGGLNHYAYYDAGNAEGSDGATLAF